ncbi:MAG TPA: hypothetical protein VLH85_09065, partial [Levilinea sp.]|nr:hypothetical protein [Levilinea sp.]
RSVLGLPAWMARWSGAVGAVLGLLFSMPFFEDILRMVWQRLRKPRRQQPLSTHQTGENQVNIIKKE